MPIRAVLILSLLFSIEAQAKSLFWPAIVVDANLDADGRMHIAETQTYDFDGDWNGGERRFRVEPNQTLHLESLTRVADDGGETKLIMGPLDKVDHYQMMDGNVLRWRSRLPTDPEFSHTRLTYRIRYTLSGVVRRVNKSYILSHDFAFPDRQGVIELFTLHFTVDPVWSGIQSPFDAQVQNLGTGRSYIVNATLGYRGARVPVAVPFGASSTVAWGLAIFFLAAIAGLCAHFVSAERKRGRFSATPLSEIDEAWLEANVLRYTPEVVGAAIDNKIGAPEVAAIMAALTHEKKIETRVEQRHFKRPLLHMTLLVPINEITGHRHTLAKRLFFKGKETDTDAIRKHYESSGFEPASLIRVGIEGDLANWPKWKEKFPTINWSIAVALVIAGIVLFWIFATDGNDGMLTGPELFFGFIALGGGLLAAHLNSRALTSLAPRFILVGAFLAPLLYATLHYTLAAPDFAIRSPALLVSIFWSLSILKIVLDKLRTDESDERIAARMRLVAAREYFLQQLRDANPRLRDDWYPYLIAFGLGPNVDAWFKSFGAAAAGSGHEFASSSSSSSISSSGSGGGWSWSGGGGAFGGAGASASWAVAAGGIASGVASPSSGGSGGGGGGGGGGSSSGGGGGGGW